MDIVKAERLLQKNLCKTYKAELWTQWKLLHRHQVIEYNGTKFSSYDGRTLLVALSEYTDEWDMSDVYFREESEDSIDFLHIGDAFNICKEAKELFHFAKGDLRKLVAMCKMAGSNYRNLKKLSEPGCSETHPGFPLVIWDFDKMSINGYSEHQDNYTHLPKMCSGYNAQHLRTVLEFILCSSGRSIEMYYKGGDNPLIFRSGRLYALVMPVRLDCLQKDTQMNRKLVEAYVNI